MPCVEIYAHALPFYMETAIIPLEMQSVGENDIFKAGEQKPKAKGTLTRLGTPSQQLT